MIATSLETVSNASAESWSLSGRLAAQHPFTIHKSFPNSDRSISIKVDKGNSSSIKPKPAPGAGPSITNHPRSAAELKVDKGNYNRIKPKALKVNSAQLAASGRAVAKENTPGSLCFYPCALV